MNGVLALVAIASVYDGLAIAFGWQTISAAVRQLRRTELGRMAVSGAAAVLITHLSESEARP